MFKNINYKKYYKYLPSTKFTYFIIVIAVLGIIIFALSRYFTNKNEYILQKNAELAVGKLSINDLLKKDTDGDNVMDWEEGLWGTDINKQTTFEGIPDADYIKNKRAELKLSDDSTASDGSLTETDKFAQEFFASILAMKQTGSIDQNTINNVSSALGQKITDPTIENIFTEKDIKLSTEDNINSQKKYYNELKKIFENSKKAGLGSELGIIGDAASSGDIDMNANAMNKLSTIASAYQDFAQKILTISVPGSFSSYQIQIANSANNTGVAVQNMTKISNDPIVGLSGLSQYKKYSDDLISSVNDLEATLLNI